MIHTTRFPADRDKLSVPIPHEAEYKERAEKLIAGPIASLHDHPVRFPEPFTQEAWQELQATKRDVLGVEELERSPLSVVIASCLGVPDLDYVLTWAAGMREDIAASKGLILGTDLAAMDEATADGATVTALYLGLEDLASIGTDLGNIERLYSAGVRAAGLAYNPGTPLGGGAGQDPDPGLTDLGEQAIKIMNRLGMILDVAHVGHRTAVQAAEITESPMITSHSGARGVWPAPRMKPDEVLRAVAGTGGVIGISASPGSTRSDPSHSRHDVEDLIAHIEYCVELVGVEHVGLGGDTFYGDHVGLHRVSGSKSSLPEGAPVFDQDLVTGAENPTEVPIQITYRLLAKGWSDADVALVLGGNTLRVMRAALGAGAAGGS